MCFCFDDLADMQVLSLVLFESKGMLSMRIILGAVHESYWLTEPVEGGL